MNIVTPLTAVLVLYRTPPLQSQCFVSLEQLLANDTTLRAHFSLLLYDNSPTAQPVPDFPAALHYHHDGANRGIAAAYNAGLELARQNTSPWLLLLDQDTALTQDYFRELRALTGDLPASVVAIIPKLIQASQVQSPRLVPRMSHAHLPEDAHGLMHREITAYNSGATVRVTAIDAFPEHFWLDFLDHAVFHELQRNGGQVWLMQAHLQHELSANDLSHSMPDWRYRNLIHAERDYFRIYGSPADRFWYHLRRAKQTLGLIVHRQPARFVLLSIRAMLGLLDKSPPRPGGGLV